MSDFTVLGMLPLKHKGNNNLFGNCLLLRVHHVHCYAQIVACLYTAGFQGEGQKSDQTTHFQRDFLIFLKYLQWSTKREIIL